MDDHLSQSPMGDYYPESDFQEEQSQATLSPNNGWQYTAQANGSVLSNITSPAPSSVTHEAVNPLRDIQAADTQSQDDGGYDSVKLEDFGFSVPNVAEPDVLINTALQCDFCTTNGIQCTYNRSKLAISNIGYIAPTACSLCWWNTAKRRAQCVSAYKDQKWFPAPDTEATLISRALTEEECLIKRRMQRNASCAKMRVSRQSAGLYTSKGKHGSLVAENFGFTVLDATHPDILIHPVLQCALCCSNAELCTYTRSHLKISALTRFIWPAACNFCIGKNKTLMCRDQYGKKVRWFLADDEAHATLVFRVKTKEDKKIYLRGYAQHQRAANRSGDITKVPILQTSSQPASLVHLQPALVPGTMPPHDTEPHSTHHELTSQIAHGTERQNYSSQSAYHVLGGVEPTQEGLECNSLISRGQQSNSIPAQPVMTRMALGLEPYGQQHSSSTSYPEIAWQQAPMTLYAGAPNLRINQGSSNLYLASGDEAELPEDNWRSQQPTRMPTQIETSLQFPGDTLMEQVDVPYPHAGQQLTESSQCETLADGQLLPMHRLDFTSWETEWIEQALTEPKSGEEEPALLFPHE